MSDILIIQTAFAGDLILTTPLIEETARCFQGSRIDVLCIPSTADLLANNPAVRDLIVYDKRNRKPGLFPLMNQIRKKKYTLCLSPHRSFRSAILARASGAPVRVAFDTASGAFLYTATATYRQNEHEAVRNLSLLRRAECAPVLDTSPRLYPSEHDAQSAAALLPDTGRPHVCVAPGSVWATKRWTEEGFAAIVRHFAVAYTVVLIGGKEDHALCERIITRSGAAAVNAAGALSLLGSAAMIRSAGVLISNDSAPVHIASAVGTPVVEIFGATVPAFGFTPVGVPFRIVEHNELECRPCGIHGGKECPIATFVCMKDLRAERVVDAAEELLQV